MLTVTAETNGEGIFCHKYFFGIFFLNIGKFDIVGNLLTQIKHLDHFQELKDELEGEN